jgi:hypothetical protein
MADNDIMHELKEYLEELISLTSQTADSAAVNLSTKFEKFESEIEEKVSLIEDRLDKKDEKRWSLFRWVITSIVGVMAAVVFVGGDRLHEQMSDLKSRMASLEKSDQSQVGIEKLIETQKELEKHDKILYNKVEDCATQKDLIKLKQEIIDIILKLRNAAASGGPNAQ